MKRLRGRQRAQLVEGRLLLRGQRSLAMVDRSARHRASRSDFVRSSPAGCSTRPIARRRPTVAAEMPRSASAAVASPSGAVASSRRASCWRAPRRGRLVSAVRDASRFHRQSFGDIEARWRQRRDANRLERIDASGQRVGRQRRGQRRARPGQVVAGHPIGERHDVGGDKRRTRPARCAHRATSMSLGRRRRFADDDAGQLPCAQWNHDARPRHRHGVVVWNAIGEQPERGHRHRDGHEPLTGEPRHRPAAAREPSSCPPTLPASPTDCASR